MNYRIRFVSLTVLISALASGCSSRHKREATLRQDLLAMRGAIQEYTWDHDQEPQSLQQLVNGHYLNEIPMDPFTQKKDWVPDVDDTVQTPDQTTAGIASVHSNPTQVGSNGSAYDTW
jgi:general secretion pathway protein G